MFATTERVGRARRAGREGFALPLAILALALITAAVAASSTSTRAEIVANQAVRAQDRAYQLAEAGLQQFVARRSEVGFCSNCVGNPETQQYRADSTEYTRVSLTGGYADVVSVRVRPKVLGDSVALFFIHSRGVDTTNKMSGAGLTVFAERTVGQYATFRTASLKPLAAWMSITGISKNSNGSAVQGADECGVQPGVAGVAVPTGEYRRGMGVTVDPIGTPNISTMSAASLMQLAGVDWNAILNNNAIPADFTIPPDAWPGAGVWKVTRIKTNPYTVPSDGNGILIVEGDLVFSGSRDFDGIILVGGRLTASGTSPSSGATLSGLNYLLPGAGSPPASAADDASLTANKPFRYNSCNVASAMGLLTTYYAWSNTWLDNVAVW